MSDTLGAAPYTPERPSLWARFATWLRRGALDEVTTYNAAVEAALGRPLGARRVHVVDAREGQRERAYVPPPAKDGPRHPSTPVRE